MIKCKYQEKEFNSPTEYTKTSNKDITIGKLNIDEQGSIAEAFKIIVYQL